VGSGSSAEALAVHSIPSCSQGTPADSIGHAAAAVCCLLQRGDLAHAILDPAGGLFKDLLRASAPGLDRGTDAHLDDAGSFYEAAPWPVFTGIVSDGNDRVAAMLGKHCTADAVAATLAGGN